MIKKSNEAKHREFKDVSFDVLATGAKSMVTKMNYKIGDNVPLHSHPNEQAGYVISGEYILEYEQLKETIKVGDSYCIPGNVEHALQVVVAGEVIDVFTPPREDYL